MKKKLITMPDNLAEEIEKMSEETQLSANQLIVMAAHSLVANYKIKGSFVFADLLNPEIRKK